MVKEESVGELSERRLVELVRVRTADGLRLDGAFQAASHRHVHAPAIAALVVSGVGGNFYGSTMLEAMAEALLRVGVTVVRVNTRGHDGVSTVATDTGGRLQGAAYEIVDECRLDLDAWVDWLVERGFPRVVLIGHSLGAVKVLYSQAHAPKRAVGRIIAISPPRLSYSRFVQGTEASAFQESFQAAQDWIQRGQPGMLFQSSFPFPLVLSAATFLDKYGPEERYNFLRFVDRLQVPVTLVYGETELKRPSSSFSGIEHEARQVSWGSDRMEWRVVPHANHFFSGQLESLADTVATAVRT